MCALVRNDISFLPLHPQQTLGGALFVFPDAAFMKAMALIKSDGTGIAFQHS